MLDHDSWSPRQVSDGRSVIPLFIRTFAFTTSFWSSSTRPTTSSNRRWLPCRVVASILHEKQAAANTHVPRSSKTGHVGLLFCLVIYTQHDWQPTTRTRAQGPFARRANLESTYIALSKPLTLGQDRGFIGLSTWLEKERQRLVPPSLPSAPVWRGGRARVQNSRVSWRLPRHWQRGIPIQRRGKAPRRAPRRLCPLPHGTLQYLLR